MADRQALSKLLIGGGLAALATALFLWRRRPAPDAGWHPEPPGRAEAEVVQIRYEVI